MEDIEGDTSKWKDSPYSWARRVNIVKMSTESKPIYRVKAISIIILMAFFPHRNREILKFMLNHKRPQIAKNILRKTKAGGIMFPDVKLYYRTIVIKIVWYWHKNRHADISTG